jgi:hypothetical protein
VVPRGPKGLKAMAMVSLERILLFKTSNSKEIKIMPLDNKTNFPPATY